MTCGIYLVTHKPSGKRYIGQSINIEVRLLMHAKAYRDTCFNRAIRKHGWNTFMTEVIEVCPRESLNDAEKKWINQFQCMTPIGYNLTTGGNQAKFSPETIEKLKLAQRNRSPEHIARKNDFFFTRLKYSLFIIKNILFIL